MSSKIPAGWSTQESRSHPGKFYYVNSVTGEKTWELPTEAASSVGAREEEVQVLHILRKHAGSRRPSSWRVAKITQSKEEAIRQVSSIRQSLITCGEEKGVFQMRAMFSDIARAESDCSSAQKGGDLGSFGRGAMQEAFEKASFALKVGEISQLADTDSGIHIILRIA